jgi:hypothetical protein
MAKALRGRLSDELSELHDRFTTSTVEEPVPGGQIHVDLIPLALLDFDDHQSEVSGRHGLGQDHGFER